MIQIQLVQPVLTIVWSALLVGEALDWTVWVGAVVVILFAALAVRARVRARSVKIEAPSA